MRSIIVGGDSNLGRVLASRLVSTPGVVVYCTTRRPIAYASLGLTHLDLREPLFPPDLAPVLRSGVPGVVYIMAAITGIMRAETDPDAWRVNAEAPVLLARHASALGWHVVFVSSGTVERAQHTALARQKSYADLGVLMCGGCVVRPLPFVPPEKYDEVAALLAHIGEARVAGVVRWEG